MLRIGVDGGGTTTRAVVIDDNLQVLGRGESGSSNHYSVGLERAVENVTAAGEAALADAGVSQSDIVGWGFGLAGACTAAEQKTLSDALSALAAGKPLVVDEDAAAAQAGAFGGGAFDGGAFGAADDAWAAGAVCIAGTGANCFGVNARGERARADGLGPLLGDRGSGYWIGEATLRAACQAHDGSGPATALLDAVLHHFAVVSVDELVQLVYRPDFGKDRVASLFPVALNCAVQDEDEVARALLRDAGHQLAATALAVLRALQIEAVAVTGGVLGRDTPVREAFENALRGSLPAARIQEPLHDAAIGAALLAKGG